MKETVQTPYSIFIPTWNNLEMLKLCIKSIEQNSAAKHEILIHVNDSSDGTLEWVTEKGYKHTHSKENIGVCWAMNSLRSLMTTDYVVYINDDMYMCPGWDTAIDEEIRKQPNDFWYLASTMIQPRPHYTRKLSVQVGDYGTSVTTFDEKRLLEEFTKYKTIDWQGAMLPPTIVHRKVWDLVGGYSIEYYPGMASDPDFNAKLWLAGVRTFKGIGNSLCYHFMSVSVNRITQNRGYLQFLRKWGVTLRAFYKYFLHADLPWGEETETSESVIRREKLRCKFKRFITSFKNFRGLDLWNNFG